MVLTTKEKLKKAALTFFAQKGYEGASMQEIAEAVGINKASIYNHYKGKEDLFLAVYEDVAREYEKLLKRLIKNSENMEIPDKLLYMFKEYILFYYKDLHISLFWTNSLILTPPEIRKKLYSDILKREEPFEKKMLEILGDGMQRGIIRRDIPSKMLISYRAMRDGLLLWMRIVPELSGEWIEVFWKDFWLGIQERKDIADEQELGRDGLNLKGSLNPPPSNKGTESLYTTTCLICHKEFGIPFSDYRYKDIKYNRCVHHVCDDCGKMIQEECQKITGLHPELIDIWEMYERSKTKKRD
ncbi:MAG TPA: TetR/AcrR family transcriptional regulator [Syntrophomonadaceae bacterium]|nr:TetR/AcrR family transcriptional regulator [Syntrophomonadaceae bacterium]